MLHGHELARSSGGGSTRIAFSMTLGFVYEGDSDDPLSRIQELVCALFYALVWAVVWLVRWGVVGGVVGLCGGCALRIL